MKEERQGNLSLGQFTQTTDGAVGYQVSCKVQDATSPTHLRTVAAAVVDTVHAPPAMIFLHDKHPQIPTALRLTESCTMLSAMFLD